MTYGQIMTKAGITLAIIASFPDGTKLVRRCKCQECLKKPANLRYRLLPCGCHGMVVFCSCRVGDKRCGSCGRVFVASKRYQAHGQWWTDVYEVEDPHGDNAKL